MPLATQVSGVKAADPGIGFTLNFDAPLNDTLTVTINLTNPQEVGHTYSSKVSLTNKVTDQSLVFVVPFGDSSYAPSNILNYEIIVDTGSNGSQTLNGAVFGESGVFDYHTNLQDSLNGLPKTGDMLQSDNGQYIGVYQNDGNFCVYPASVHGKGKTINQVYNTSSDVNQPTNFQLVQLSGQGKGLCMLYITVTGVNTLVSSSAPFYFNPINQPKFTINSGGQLCIGVIPLAFSPATANTAAS